MMALLLMSGSSTRPSSSMPEFPRYYCLVPTKSCFLIIMLTSTIRYCKALATDIVRHWLRCCCLLCIQEKLWVWLFLEEAPKVVEDVEDNFYLFAYFGVVWGFRVSPIFVFEWFLLTICEDKTYHVCWNHSSKSVLQLKIF